MSSDRFRIALTVCGAASLFGNLRVPDGAAKARARRRACADGSDAFIAADDSIGEALGMATLTVRNLDDEVVRRLQIRAAEHGRSAEAELREILRQALLDEGRPGRAELAARLAEFRERTAVEGSPSVLELLRESRTERLKTLTRGDGSA